MPDIFYMLIRQNSFENTDISLDDAKRRIMMVCDGIRAEEPEFLSEFLRLFP